MGILLFCSIASGQTITSKTSAGNWEDASSWVGGAVPTQNNDVVIAGTISVTSSNSACRNLTINSGTFLQNGGGLGWVTLHIYGSITNNGTIRNNPTAYLFNIELRGDIHNNGIWTPAETYITTKQDQHISQTAGKVFEHFFAFRDANGYVDTNGKLIATSDLTFSDRFDLKWLSIDLASHNLTLKAAANLSWGTIKNARHLYFEDSSYLWNATIAGPTTELHGTARIDGNVTFTADIINNDIIQQTGGLGWVTPIFYGNLTNNGTIRNNPITGYLIALDLRGDIHNNGIWKPSNTYIGTKQLQHISQTTGKIFENPFRLTDGSGYTDTNGSLVATTPLTFSDQFDLKWRFINMDSFTLTLKAGGHLSWGTIDNVHDIYFRDSSYLFSTIIGSSVNLHGIARIADAGVTFKADVNNLDTMQHTGGLGWVTATFLGNLTNNGVIRNNPLNNWGLDVRADKDIKNNGIWKAGLVILDGESRRTIDLRNAFVGIRVEGKKVVLAGDNYLPTLAMSSGGVCYVASEGSLIVEDGTTDYGWNGVTNLGKIVIPKKTASGTTKYDFYSGTVYFKNGVPLPDSVIVESYGRQTPKTFGNATTLWWRLRTNPQTPDIELQYLDLYYSQTDVNGIAEKDLQLFRSIDTGKTWIQIDATNLLYRDTNGNYIRFQNIPCSGDYVLASANSAPTPSRPNIRVSLIGNPDLRVLAPNRQIVNMYNNSDAPSGDFVISIEFNEQLRLLKAEDDLDGFKRTYGVDDILTDSTDQYATFLIRSLGPREERDFTIYATSKTTSTIINGKDPQPKFFWFIGIAAAYVAGAYINDYITDKMVQGCFDLWAPSGGATEEQKQLAGAELSSAAKKLAKDAAISTGKQLAEDGAKQILKHNILGKLIWPAKLGVNILSCFENTVKGLQCYQGQNMVRDVFTHVECNGSQKQVRVITSRDPNHKSGPSGYGSEGFIASTQRMDYMIECENASDAAAAAYKIVIVDSLAPEFDENTVTFGRMSHNYTAARDGRVLKWEIVGIDLPPNKVPTEGESWVSYSVLPKSNLPSGTVFGNKASITFDVNAPIITNTHTNTLDIAPPVTMMRALPSKTNDSVVTIKWSSIDAGGSGYESAELYMAKDDGEYNAICSQNSDSVQVSVEFNHTYSFFALAKDNVGNMEISRPMPISTRVTSGVKPNADQIDFWLRNAYPNPTMNYVYFDYSLSRNGLTSLTIIDGLGKTITTLVNGYQHEGVYHKNIDCSTYSNGTYYVRLEQGNLVRTRKFVINH
jgi:hypothetical protein